MANEQKISELRARLAAKTDWPPDESRHEALSEARAELRAEERHSLELAEESIQGKHGGILVRAFILPGKEDPSAAAGFANSDRAEGYAVSLLTKDGYREVTITAAGRATEVLRRHDVGLS